MAKSGTKTFVMVLKILLSIFLSSIFVITAFVLPIYYSVAGIFTPKTVTTVVQNIDFVEIIKDSEEFNTVIEDLGIDKNAVNKIVQSDEFGNFLESCTGTVMDAIINDPHKLESFDVGVLQDIVNNHVDDITAVLQEEINGSIKKEDVQSTMHKFLEENSDQIKENILYLAPSNEKSHPAYKIMSFIQTTLKLPVILLAILFEVLLLGLIYLLNKNKFGGFIWTTVNSAILLILLTLVFALFKSNFITNAFISAPNIWGNVATTMLGTVTAKLLIAIIVLLLLITACIIAFILLKKYAAKKEVVAINETSIEPETITKAEQPLEEVDE